MSTRAPAVSVLLPVFNAAKTIGRAIASIRAQHEANWEMIIVDDGSTDGTAAVVDVIAQLDPRIRFYRQPHRGLVGALNFGLEQLHAEFVARMDADDVSAPERLGEQIAFLRAHANRAIGVVGCQVAFGGERSASEGYALHVDWLNSLVTADDIALNRFVESPLAHPSVMFRRELCSRHGGYREGDFPEDYELWLRWLDAGVQIAKVPRVLLTWHDSSVRMSRTDPRYSPEAFFRTKAPWLARWLIRADVGGANGRRIFVWGAGRPTRKRAALLDPHGVTVSGYVDVDAKKITSAIGGTGLPVITPEQLPAPGNVFVLGYVSSRGAREYIRDDLRRRQYVEGRDFIMCA